MRVHEIGAVLLTSIPDAVKLCGAPELALLPRILVSCDGVIMDGSRVTALVECKHRTPYAPPARDRKELTFLGRRRKPHAAVTVEHYAQTQLKMLVMGAQRCDLIPTRLRPAPSSASSATTSGAAWRCSTLRTWSSGT